MLSLLATCFPHKQKKDGVNLSLSHQEVLLYPLSVTLSVTELQGQATGTVWEYKGSWQFPGKQQDNANPTAPCLHSQRIWPPFISFPNAAAHWKMNPKAQESQHKAPFSTLEVIVQKAPAAYPGPPRAGASHWHWSISVPLVPQATEDGEDHPSMQLPSTWEHCCQLCPQVMCSRQQYSAVDGIPAFLGNHAGWFKASSIICWQTEAGNHLFHINTPPWTSQPPAPFCASPPHHNLINVDRKPQFATGCTPYPNSCWQTSFGFSLSKKPGCLCIKIFQQQPSGQEQWPELQSLLAISNAHPAPSHCSWQPANNQHHSSTPPTAPPFQTQLIMWKMFGFFPSLSG